MITAYAIPAAGPLQAQVGTTMTLASLGWAALVPLAAGVVTALLLLARKRYRRREGAVAPGDGLAPQPRLAA
jgi:hypothetical protein